MEIRSRLERPRLLTEGYKREIISVAIDKKCDDRFDKAGKVLSPFDERRQSDYALRELYQSRVGIEI